MKNYIIYFEIFGKKMKTTIPALNKEDAMNCLKDKIIFHKVSHERIEDTDFFKEMVNIFNPKGK